MLKRLLLTVLAVFAVSSPALAYPLNPYQVVWPFEGHGSVPGGVPVHAITGELKFSDPAFGPTVIVTVYAEGDPTRISAFVNATILDGSISGYGGGFYEVSPVIPGGQLQIGLHGVGWEEGFVDPNGFLLPPSHAPDIGLFDAKQILSYYEVCMDSRPLGSCASGGGLHYRLDSFAITIDRFVDPVPEPAGLALIAAARLVRRPT